MNVVNDHNYSSLGIRYIINWKGQICLSEAVINYGRLHDSVIVTIKITLSLYFSYLIYSTDAEVLYK